MQNADFTPREIELLKKSLSHTSKKLRDLTTEYGNLIIEENHQDLKIFYEYEDLLKKIESFQK
jgi:hypothetical protein